MWQENSEGIVIKKVVDPVFHAEGPHWDDKKNVLLYVDIAGNAVLKYDPKDDSLSQLKLKKNVGVVVPIKQADDLYMIGYGTDIAELKWDGQKTYSLQILHTVDKDKPGNRFNDGKVDVNGNFWIGTMGSENDAGQVDMNKGSLYRLNAHCKLEKFISPVSISNGIAWNKDNSLMFYIDSPTRRVDVFDYNKHTSHISNRRTFFDFKMNNVIGVPDGMTIDSEDNLWVACWAGSQVIQISGKSGQLLRSIKFPVERVTSVTFGGNELATLYVTTMKTGLSKEQLRKQPLAGALFSVEGLGVQGTLSKPASCSAKP